MSDVANAGVDEVGRGPLAGPVVAAAVILPQQYVLPGLTDSKRLAARRREALAQQIQIQALAWALGEASPVEIDQMNIHRASLLAMQRALLALPMPPDQVWVDGRFAPQGPWPTITVIKGDALVPAISAASILAKVERDRQLQAMHSQYPLYGFDRHVGYPTPQHLRALKEHGPCPAHRQSFAPVAAAVRR